MSAVRRGREARREARGRMYAETAERYRELLAGEEPDEAAEEVEPVEEPTPDPDELGWRSSRRTSRIGKTARRALKRDKRVKAVKETTEEAARTSGRFLWNVVRWAGGAVLGLGVLVLALMLVAWAINGVARWAAERSAADEPDPAIVAQDNLLVIGIDDAGEVMGFLALRAEEDEERVFGIAIPDAAFMEVPGQGFERAGDSFRDGPGVSTAAISNFLSVTFDQYVIVEAAAYQRALQDQSLETLLDLVLETNLEADEVDRFRSSFEAVTGDAVALVPLPVKPISLGDETYFEPQREEVADLLFSWWGVSMGSDKDTIRVIVYNGSGVPGIAGTAAQELISRGFRVVETRNAESFDYEDTLVILYHGEMVDAERVRDTLGAGEITVQEASQQIADVIVIIGADYSPPDQDG